VRGIRQLVALARDNGGRQDIRKPVEATAFGHWAVHRHDREWGGGWSVTHVPSGMAARQAIKTATEAKRIAKTLAVEFNLETAARIQALKGKARKRIKEIVRGEGVRS
jgi:ABC-type branched-subunit amino acid transport system ATPase component